MSIGAGWTRNSASGPTYMELEAELARVRAENERLRSVLSWCWGMAGTGYHIDGNDFQEAMLERGLLVKVPADEAFRAEYDEDTMFVVVWNPLAAAEREEP